MSTYPLNDFVQRLKTSEVLSENVVSGFVLDNFSDARYLAKHLVDQQLLTEWQAKFLLSGRSQLKIGPYTLLDRVDKNELGDRYLAKHQSLERLVELQFLPKEFARNSPHFESFIGSINMLTEVDHPNLAHVYDVGEESDRYYVVQEHVAGTTLGDLDKTLEPVQAVRMINELASAVRFLHSKKIRHGSISKNNVVINPLGQLQINGVTIKVLHENVLGRKNPLAEQQEAQQFGLIDRVALQGLAGELVEWAFGDRGEPQLWAAIVQLGRNESGLSQLEQLTSQWLSHQRQSKSNSRETVSPSELNPAPPASSRDAPKKSAVRADTIPRHNNPILLVALGLFAVLTVLGLFAYLSGWFSNGKNRSSTAQNMPVDRQTSMDNQKSSPIASKRSSNSTVKTENNADDLTSANSGKKDPVGNSSSQQNQDPQDQVLKTNPTKTAGGTAVEIRKTEEVPTANPDVNTPPNDIPPKVTSSERSGQSQSDPFVIPGNNNVRSPIDPNQPTDIQSPIVPGTSPNSKTTPSNDVPSPQKKVQDLTDFLEIAPADGQSTPQVLAEFVLPEGADLTLDLKSDGESNGKGKNFFGLTASPRDHEWVVNYSKSKEMSESTAIAQFRYDGTTLSFNWLDQVDAKSNANFMINSLLFVADGQNSKWVPLRKPLVVESLATNEKSFSVSEKLDVPWLPAAEAIRLEFGAFDPSVWNEPVIQNPELADRLPATIRFRASETEQVVWFAIRLEAKSKVEIGLDVQTVLNGELISLKPQQLDSLMESITQEYQALVQKNDQAQVAAQNAPYGQKTKTRDFAKAVRESMEQAQQFRTLAAEQISIIKGLQGTTVPLRVVYLVDGQAIELARTSTFSPKSVTTENSSAKSTSSEKTSGK